MTHSPLPFLAIVAATAALWTPARAQEADAFRDGVLSGTLDWSAVEDRAAAEGTVRFYHWGGSDLLNVWLDRVVAPAMKARGVALDAVRITATKDAVDLVLAEKGAGQGPGEGSVDVIWLNGENFASLKRQDALFGAFVSLLPEAANLDLSDDPRAQLNLRDFGVETGGAEVPWSGEQYVCVFDADRVDRADLPSDLAGLRAYLQANPGKFTYVKPPHYLGNTFVQQAVYAMNPDGTGAEPFQQSADEIGAQELARLVAPGIDYLESIEPLLLGGPEGAPRYPEDEAALDGLFLQGEVDFVCKFGLFAVATGLATGAVPAGAEQFIFPEGAMIKNKSYLAIPSNAPNPAAALVLADWMTSVEAQVSKLEAVGYPAGIDGWMLPEADAARLAAASPGLVGVTQDALDANAAPDTNATLVDVIEAVWLERIERGSDAPVAEIVARAYGARE